MTRSPRLRAAALLLAAGMWALLVAPAAPGQPVERTASSTPSATPTAAGSPTATQPSALGAGALALRIESVSPAIPQPGDTVRVSGTVANTSDQPVTSVRAALRVSATPIPSRGELAEILDGGGQRMGVTVPADSASVDVPTLAPGEASPFAVSVPVDSLGLASAGAYMVGVEALGDSGAGVQRQDLGRTFLPWWPEDTSAKPLLLTLLWPLTGAPMRDGVGVWLDEQLAVEMSPSGRLDVLLAAAAQHPGVATVVTDPQVLQAADDMAEGYLVQRDGEPTTGTRSREVGQWLEAIRDAAGDADGDVAAMLYGQPDVVAARHGRALGALLRQRPLADALTAEALDRRLPSTVVLVPGGLADEPTLRRLAESDVGAVVLSDAAMPVSSPTFFTPSGNVEWATDEDRLKVLLTDGQLDATLRMPMASSSEQVAARQRLLAETLTTALELPESQRLLVASPASDWSPGAGGAGMVLETLDAAPWVTPTSLDRAVAREPSNVAHSLAPYPTEQTGELSSASVSRARALAADLATYGSALTDPKDLPAVTRTAPTRILSGWFRTRPDEQSQLMRTVSRQTNEALRSVRIVSSGSITVSGNSGTIPVTVENTGAAEVTVGLTLTGDPSQLFNADPVAPFAIQPGRRTSVEVQADVNAAGPIPVTITATTVDGTAFGVPGVLTVSSSAYANAARLLVQASLAILLVTVLVHGVRRARRRSRPEAPNPPTPDPPTAAADEAAELEVPRG